MTDTLLVIIAFELVVLLDRLGWGFRKFSWQHRLHTRFERWSHRRKGWE